MQKIIGNERTIKPTAEAVLARTREIIEAAQRGQSLCRTGQTPKESSRPEGTLKRSATSFPIQSCFPLNDEEWRLFVCLPGMAGMSGIPKKYLTGTPKYPEGTMLKYVDDSVRKMLYIYLKNIADAKEMGKGVIFSGGQSSGKTSCLALIAEAWGRKNGTQKKLSEWNPHYVPTMKYIQHNEFCNEYNSYPPDSLKLDWREGLKRLSNVDLLLYDDIGAGALTSIGSTNLLSVMESRICNNLVTCFTMNGKLEDLKSTSDGNLRRLAEKLKDALMAPVNFPNVDKREYTAWGDLGGVEK
jgi:hypothetical protein